MTSSNADGGDALRISAEYGERTLHRKSEMCLGSSVLCTSDEEGKRSSETSSVKKEKFTGTEELGISEVEIPHRGGKAKQTESAHGTNNSVKKVIKREEDRKFGVSEKREEGDHSTVAISESETEKNGGSTKGMFATHPFRLGCQ